jgi:hypothetical protein
MDATSASAHQSNDNRFMFPSGTSISRSFFREERQEREEKQKIRFLFRVLRVLRGQVALASWRVGHAAWMCRCRHIQM